jgi:hypothetical protein
MLTVDYRTLTPDNIPTPTNKQEWLALLMAANDVLNDIDRQLTEWDVMLEAAHGK